jgi:methanogenic corrinoid protein MtbC1
VENIAKAIESLRSVLEKELPEDTQSLANEYLSGAITAIDQEPSHQTAELAADTDEGKLAASYLLALLEGDRQKAISIIHDAASRGWSLTDLYLRVLSPAQAEVGRMWMNDEVNIAEEHLATATTKMVMAQLRGKAELQPPNGKTLIAAAVPGDDHDVGLQMVADVFEIDGWQTISLGANVPTPDLIQAAETFQADLLLISAALANHLTTVRDTIQAVRQYPPTSRIRIMVGGTAFTNVADLAEQYGADGYATNASEALKLANQLVGLTE